jgi:hypothetical protein
MAEDETPKTDETPTPTEPQADGATTDPPGGES